MKSINIWQHRIVGVAFVMMLHTLLFASYALAQNDRSHIRSGNRAMRAAAEGAAAKAEVSYRKALAANQSNTQAMYNLGCALMAQQKDSAAMEMFEKASKAETSKQRRAMSYHNMGVILQKNQQYAQAAEMYKQALRLQPRSMAAL